MKILKSFFAILLITISAISCTGDDGTNGTNGTNGMDGQTGTTGTANVVYSDWLTAPAAVAENIDGTSGLSTSINAPELSDDILAKGTVLVYMSFGVGTYTLPYTSTAGGSANTIISIATLKKIKLFRFIHSGVGTAGLPTTLKWRYILIPGGIAATTGKNIKTNYSKMSYEEVCTHFNIKP